MRFIGGNFWKKYFQEYDKLNEFFPYQELLQEFVQEIRPRTKVLDLGSGTGNLTILLKKQREADVTGVDIEVEGVRLHKVKDPDAKVLVQDISKRLPFPEATFDYVVCNNTLYAIPPNDRIKVLREVFRVLKRGGKFILSNPSKKMRFLTMYKDHILQEIKKWGWLRTLIRTFLFLIPTIKILHYNILLKKEAKSGSYSYFSSGEQRNLLKKVFIVRKSTKVVYSGQSFFDIGVKP